MSDLGASLPDVTQTGALGVVLVIIAYVVRMWRDGRHQNVEYERAGREAAERERDRLMREHVADRAALTERISALEREVRGLRDEHNRYLQQMTDRHRDEIRTLNRRLDTGLRMEYRLREWMAQNGWSLPVDLDPAHPEVTPDLGPTAVRPEDR